MNARAVQSSSTSELFSSYRKRRRVREGDEDQEGWIVSYADLITLLFIFFSVLLSMSQISKAKFEMLSSQMGRQGATSLSHLKDQIDRQIREQKLESAVTTEMSDEGLLVQFSETVLFASGEAGIAGRGQTILKQFAPVLNEISGTPFKLAIEGHTDRQPIHNAKFESNWSLSASRAVNVLHFMAQSGLNPSQMLIRAFADTRPLADANLPLERNRRVTLLVF